MISRTPLDSGCHHASARISAVGRYFPSIAAHVTGLAFLAASAATNVRYAVTKSADPIEQGIAALIAAAVAIGLALAITALCGAVRTRRPVSGLVALAAVGLFGSYSVTAALGSFGGHRLDAAGASQDAAGARSRAQTAYDAADRELASLAPARPVAEVEAEITRQLASYRWIERDCQGWQPDVKARGICIQVADARTELARAQRRAELQQRIDDLRGELATGHRGVANADAAMLAAIVEAIGVKADHGRLNLILTALAVLVLETGAGLCFAIGEGGAASARRTLGRPAMAAAAPIEADTTRRLPAPAVQPADTKRPASGPKRPADSPVSQPNGQSARVLQALADRNGTMSGGQRAIAEVLGLSKSRTNELLHSLAASGKVELDTTTRGTTVRLVRPA